VHFYSARARARNRERASLAPPSAGSLCVSHPSRPCFRSACSQRSAASPLPGLGFARHVEDLQPCPNLAPPCVGTKVVPIINITVPSSGESEGWTSDMAAELWSVKLDIKVRRGKSPLPRVPFKGKRAVCSKARDRACLRGDESSRGRFWERLRPPLQK
jgi:hypothetical protein